MEGAGGSGCLPAYRGNISIPALGAGGAPEEHPVAVAVDEM